NDTTTTIISDTNRALRHTKWWKPSTAATTTTTQRPSHDCNCQELVALPRCLHAEVNRQGLDCQEERTFAAVFTSSTTPRSAGYDVKTVRQPSLVIRWLKVFSKTRQRREDKMPTTLLTHVQLLLLACFLARHAAAQAMAKTDEERALEQRFHLWKAGKECNETILKTVMPTDGVYCNMTFDTILCWPYTRAGTIAELPCPGHIERFTPDEIATRECLSNGTWQDHPTGLNNTGDGWTNYSACILPPPTREPPPFVSEIIKEHMPNITLVSKVGYSISLVSLILAIIIMIYLKRLHCHRNILHINLFVSFTLRAVVCLLKDSLLVKGLGLPQDVIYDQDGDVSFNKEGLHWECKLLMTMFQLAISANYMWIFVEGLYLHTLIFFAVFSQSKHLFRWYIVIGWVTPCLFVIPWVLARIYKNDTICWNTHEEGYYWILKGPIIASITINFCFFVNIMRVLFTKLRAANTRDPQRYKKLARSTLVLIPLFGMTLSSFQGTVVAFLFCFLNGEVRGEITKEWTRSKLRRYSTVSMGRSSRAQSTTSFFFKERPSISQGPDGARRGSTRFPAVDSNVSLRSMAANGIPCNWGIIMEEHHDDVSAETGLVGTQKSLGSGVVAKENGSSGPIFRPNQNGHAGNNKTVTLNTREDTPPPDSEGQEALPMLKKQNGHNNTTI
ncbi:hypothetical protein BaRGS_00035730, partial [Batillaria attramentaria]